MLTKQSSLCTKDLQFSFPIFLVFLLLAVGATGQVTKDTLLAHQLKIKADSLFKVELYEAALQNYGKANTLFYDAGTWVRSALCKNQEARTYFRLGDYEKAHDKLHESLALISEKVGKTVFEKGQAYDLLSLYYEVQESDFEKALDYLKMARKIFGALPDNTTNLAKNSNNIGRIFLKMGEYDKALDFFDQSITSAKKIHGEYHEIISAALNNKGVVQNRLGDYEAAAKNFETSIRIDKKIYGEKHHYVLGTYMNLGALYQNLGQLTKSLESNEKALSLIDANKLDKSITAANLYTNNAIVYQRMNQPEKSMQYAKKAVRIWHNIYGEHHYEADIALKALAISYHKLGQHDLAIEKMEQVLQVNRKTLGEKHVHVAEAHGELGDFYKAKGNHQKSLEHHQKSLDIYKSIHSGPHNTIAQGYYDVSQAYRSLKKDSLQIHYLEKSVKMEKTLFSPGDEKRIGALVGLANNYLSVGEMQKSRKVLDDVLREAREYEFDQIDEKTPYSKLKALMNLNHSNGRWYLKEFEKENSKMSLEKALQYFMRSDSIIDRVALGYGFNEDRFTFRNSVQMVYEDAFTASAHLANFDVKALPQAYYFAEKGRGTILKQVLNQKNIKQFSGPSIETVRELQEFKNKRAYYQSRIVQSLEAEPIDSSNLVKFEDKLFLLNRKNDSLLAILAIEYPDYFKLQHKIEVIPLKTVQKSLSDNAVILEYFYNQEATYLMLITKNSLQIKPLQADGLQEDIIALNEAIREKDNPLYKELAHKLYKSLIAPIGQEIANKSLIVVPYGQLWQLNFDLLLTASTSTNNPKDFPYLLRKHAVSYSNSAAQIGFLGNNDAKVVQECLAFSFTGDSVSNQMNTTIDLNRLRDGAIDLPGTRKEIHEIAKVLDGVYFYGSRANEANFKRNAGKYAILHLAVHGEVNDQNPNNSRLFFTQSRDSLEDDHLFSHELFAMDINAELAVLSACSTGSGRLTSGEGVMSLGNAFQYAGTKSLVLTQWEVSDNSAPDLMGNFYQNLKSGMTKSKALQHAKLAYLQSADVNRLSPFYWGSFYLLGNNEPIQFSDANYSYWIVLAFLLLIAGFFVLKRINLK